MKSVDKNELLRGLPKMDRILATDEVASMKRHLQAELVDDAIRAELADARAEILDGGQPGDLDPSNLARGAAARLAQQLQEVTDVDGAVAVEVPAGIGLAPVGK